MSSIYSDLDRLVLDRWTDVQKLAEAQRDIQDRIEQAVETAGERIGRWLREQGYESVCDSTGGEIGAWKPSWADRRKGPMVTLLLGGFCPVGYRKADEEHPYLWVYTGGLEEFKVKEAARIAFGLDLRRELGASVAEWEADDTDDADSPLGRYMSDLGTQEQCRLVSDPDALVTFAKEYYPKLFALSDAIDACIARLPR